MHRFKIAILAIFQLFQNGTFEPVHEIQFFFLAPMNPYQAWKAKLEGTLSLVIDNCKKAVCTQSRPKSFFYLCYNKENEKTC